jgi:GNAT superfamily N-acetyltransferase
MAGTAFRIRAATPDDARPIAEVHVASWREAYRDVLPADFLERLSVDEREAQRLAILTDPEERSGTVVAETDRGIVGFAVFCRSRDEDAGPDTGEIPAIYVAPDLVGTGVGRALFGAALDGLREAGYSRATLWVLEANERARRFYERAGWTWDGTTSDHQFECANRPIVRYAGELSG